ncbi:MAG: hypothetical protein E7579_04705 [Ruminococcaceae bacterium]|nr:hypothetical protein [Oscillospiraceae bacterium]
MEFAERKNHRLKNYDYGTYGYYHVTICTHHRFHLLSDVVGDNAQVILSDIGKKVSECWNNIALLNPNVELDQYVIMPNHIHGIIVLRNPEIYKYHEKSYDFEISESPEHRSLQGLIRDFKSVTTRYYKSMYHVPHSLWQDSFYDEKIKNLEQYRNTCRYITDNPRNWHLDNLYVER